MPNRQHHPILVLDRAPEVRNLLCEVLREEGFRVTAPDSLPEEPHEVERLRPALVILDHFLGTDPPGWQLLQRLRTDPQTQAIPVLVCTAAVKEVRAREGDLAGLGTAVIRKPFDLDEFLGAVRDALRSRPAQEEHLWPVQP